ncbi:MAG: hypothetical protein AAGF75_14625 [Cyanobacteria bacterium P01_H01_bin.130]
MTRDLFNVLFTAILMVLGLAALESGTTLRGDRGGAVEPCDALDMCLLPRMPKGDSEKWELQRWVKTGDRNKS